jgi:hypothetical protein
VSTSNVVDSLGTIRALRDKGVRVVFEKENLTSTDAAGFIKGGWLSCDKVGKVQIYTIAGEE